LRLNFVENYSLTIHPALLPSGNLNLRTISVENSGLRPGALRKLIQSDRLPNLKDFIISEPCGALSRKGINKLIHALARHCCTLEQLKLVKLYGDSGSTSQPSEGVLQLCCLKTLAIDFDILFHRGSLPNALDPFAILPPTLDCLHITNIYRMTLVEILQPHLSAAEKSISYMRDLVRIYRIRRLSITVNIDDENGDMETLEESDEVKLLGKIAVALAAMGTVFAVYEDTWDTDSILLVRGDEVVLNGQ
jgi:hypothetical protein